MQTVVFLNIQYNCKAGYYSLSYQSFTMLTEHQWALSFPILAPVANLQFFRCVIANHHVDSHPFCVI